MRYHLKTITLGILCLIGTAILSACQGGEIGVTSSDGTISSPTAAVLPGVKPADSGLGAICPTAVPVAKAALCSAGQRLLFPGATIVFSGQPSDIFASPIVQAVFGSDLKDVVKDITAKIKLPFDPLSGIGSVDVALQMKTSADKVSTEDGPYDLFKQFVIVATPKVAIAPVELEKLLSSMKIDDPDLEYTAIPNTTAYSMEWKKSDGSNKTPVYIAIDKGNLIVGDKDSVNYALENHSEDDCPLRELMNSLPQAQVKAAANFTGLKPDLVTKLNTFLNTESKTQMAVVGIDLLKKVTIAAKAFVHADINDPIMETLTSLKYSEFKDTFIKQMIAAIADTGSNSSQDTTAPTVTTKNPTDNEVGVLFDKKIMVRFSQGMDAGSISATSFQVETKDANNVFQAVDGTVSYDSAGQAAIFQPTMGLKPSTQYSVTLTQNIRNLSGIALDKVYKWTFTTATATAAEAVPVP